MRIIGFHRDSAVWVGAVKGEAVTPLCEVGEFYNNLDHWLQAATTAADAIPLASIQEAPAVWPGARILCVGLNYRAHAAEGGFEPPKFPAIFGRWARSLNVNNGKVPVLDTKLDWEVELAAVIGKKLAGVSVDEAKAGIFGYAAFNDISARAYQRHTQQWTPGKNMDGSGPISPITTADEAGDPEQGLHIETRLNGEVMQSGNTADMVFTCGQIISYLSAIMTLYPGDVIVSGTCEGVGYPRKPPIFMKPGDVIEVAVETVGAVRSLIVDAGERNG